MSLGGYLYPRCNHKAHAVEAAPHIHLRMLVRVSYNLVEEGIRGQLNKTAGDSRCSDEVQRHRIPGQDSKT
jgi:hypothetical protein